MDFKLYKKRFLVTCICTVVLSVPVQAAQSFLIADNQTGSILQSNNQDRKLPIGSLAQIATAVVAIDWIRTTNTSFSNLAVVPPSATSSQSTVGLQVGDQISLRDLVYCMILSSDRIAADTIANYIGSQIPNPHRLAAIDNFVTQMNALARQLQMKRTLFLNPDGSDRQRGRQPFSTAMDVARLTRHAYLRPEFPFYASQAFRTINLTRNGQPLSLRIRNTNMLLGNNRIDGVKLGYSPRTGQGLVLTANRPPLSTRQGNFVTITPRRLIIILLGSSDSFNEGFALLQQGWTLYDEWAANGRLTQKAGFL